MRQNQRPTLILAKSVTEANRYARVAGLPRFQYRAIRSAGSIRATRNADIHLLSSFLKRPDRHAIIGALRHTRCDVYFVDLADFDLDPVVEDPRGDLTERQLEVAYRFNAWVDLAVEQFDQLTDDTPAVTMPTPDLERLEAQLEPEGWEPPDSLTAKQVLELAANPEKPGSEVLAEEPKQRRRSRCKDCGNLHFADEACPTSAAPDFFGG